MSWQTWQALVAVWWARGCWPGRGDGGGGGLSGPAGPGAGAWGKRVDLIGFDASEPVIAGLRQGSIEGVVLQTPLEDGRTGRQDAGSASREVTCRAKPPHRGRTGHARKHEHARHQATG